MREEIKFKEPELEKLYQKAVKTVKLRRATFLKVRKGEVS